MDSCGGNESVQAGRPAASCRSRAPFQTKSVGPIGACTAAGWSPDGSWMYFTAALQGHSHLWRQHFPDGSPEQLTFGPTDDQGLAVEPSGKSLITSVGVGQSDIWIHDPSGDRPLTSEGQVVELRVAACIQPARPVPVLPAAARTRSIRPRAVANQHRIRQKRSRVLWNFHARLRPVAGWQTSGLCHFRTWRKNSVVAGARWIEALRQLVWERQRNLTVFWPQRSNPVPGNRR